MVIDYSSFTHTALLGVITKDGDYFKSSNFYDANEEIMLKFEMIEPEWFTFTGANNDCI